MAAVYSFYDAVKTIAEGKDIETIIDITKRFPNLAILAAKASAGSNAKFVVELAKAVPDYVTARKAENAYKGLVGDSEDQSEDEPTEDKEEPKSPAKKAEKPAGADSPKSRRGRPRKNAKPEPEVKEEVPFDEDTPEEEADEDSAEDLGKYAGMKASELYKELKSRGIKAKPRQDASVYAELLIEDDKKADEADDAWGDDDEDDWDI